MPLLTKLLGRPHVVHVVSIQYLNLLAMALIYLTLLFQDYILGPGIRDELTVPADLLFLVDKRGEFSRKCG